jgi:predicted transposase YdaD
LINLVVESEEQAVPQAKGLIEKAQNQLTDERLQRQLIDLIERIIVYKFPQKNREEIEAMFNLSDLKQTKVYQEAFTDGEANLVLLILNSRFKEISPSLIEQIRGLSIEQLENLGKALLNFGSEGDLIQWLAQNS